MIDKRENELLNAIEKQRQEQEKKLSSDKESLEYLLESMSHCCEYTGHLLEYGNPVEIVATSQAVISRLSTLIKTQIPSPQGREQPFLLFKENGSQQKQQIQFIISSLGQVVPLPFSCQFISPDFGERGKMEEREKKSEKERERERNIANR